MDEITLQNMVDDNVDIRLDGVVDVTKPILIDKRYVSLRGKSRNTKLRATGNFPPLVIGVKRADGAIDSRVSVDKMLDGSVSNKYGFQSGKSIAMFMYTPLMMGRDVGGNKWQYPDKWMFNTAIYFDKQPATNQRLYGAADVFGPQPFELLVNDAKALRFWFQPAGPRNSTGFIDVEVPWAYHDGLNRLKLHLDHTTGILSFFHDNKLTFQKNVMPPGTAFPPEMWEIPFMLGTAGDAFRTDWSANAVYCGWSYKVGDLDNYVNDYTEYFTGDWYGYLEEQEQRFISVEQWGLGGWGLIYTDGCEGGAVNCEVQDLSIISNNNGLALGMGMPLDLYFENVETLGLIGISDFPLSGAKYSINSHNCHFAGYHTDFAAFNQIGNHRLMSTGGIGAYGIYLNGCRISFKDNVTGDRWFPNQYVRSKNGNYGNSVVIENHIIDFEYGKDGETSNAMFEFDILPGPNAQYIKLERTGGGVVKSGCPFVRLNKNTFDANQDVSGNIFIMEDCGCAQADLSCLVEVNDENWEVTLTNCAAPDGVAMFGGTPNENCRAIHGRINPKGVYNQWDYLMVGEKLLRCTKEGTGATAKWGNDNQKKIEDQIQTLQNSIQQLTVGLKQAITPPPNTINQP